MRTLKTETSPSQGAAIQSWKPESPRALLRLILDDASDPHDRPLIKEQFMERVLPKGGTSRIITNIVEYWFDNNYRSAVRSYPENPQDEAEKVAERNAMLEQSKREIERRRGAIEVVINKKADEKVVLMLRTMMPIGKAFGDCTGSELRGMREHLPKALDAVIVKVGDNVLVRSVFSNKQLAKMALRLGSLGA